MARFFDPQRTAVSWRLRRYRAVLLLCGAKNMAVSRGLSTRWGRQTTIIAATQQSRLISAPVLRHSDADPPRLFARGYLPEAICPRLFESRQIGDHVGLLLFAGDSRKRHF